MVGLVAVIAALAIPAYQDYIVRSKRSAARQVLMEGAQYLERNYTTAGCYDFADTASCLARSGSATVQPSTLLRAPSEGKQSYFVAWTLAGNGQAYTLTATPCAQRGSLSLGRRTDLQRRDLRRADDHADRPARRQRQRGDLLAALSALLLAAPPRRS